jgi:hypothetical protein
MEWVSKISCLMKIRGFIYRVGQQYLVQFVNTHTHTHIYIYIYIYIDTDQWKIND